MVLAQPHITMDQSYLEMFCILAVGLAGVQKQKLKYCFSSLNLCGVIAAKDLGGYEMLLMFHVSFTFLGDFWGWRKAKKKKKRK